MIRTFSKLFLIVLPALFAGCGTTHKAVTVTAADKNIHAQGRVAVNQDMMEIYWPGSGVKMNFKGSFVKASLEDEKGFNYFNVVVDDSLVNVIKLDTARKDYLLASGLSAGIHTIELLKRADWFRGKTRLYSFEVEARADDNIPAPKKRSIEFYGNSITVGAAVEDYKGDSGDSTYTNNYNSYAAITARHFDADYSCIASSGIGLMVSWGSLVMPEIYDRLNPDDSTSKWDFSKTKPAVVVVNLFQNDYSLVNSPDHPQFKRRFGNKAPSEDSIITSYRNFIERLRGHYPDAYIICVLGSMDAVSPGSLWPGYIEKAAERLKDNKVFTHFFPYKNTPGHPKTEEQKKMAQELIGFIETHVKW